ncbi:MAG: AAA family ATPase [Patescibacteria group bacterium]|jgi:hypothetical protein
MGSKHGLKFKKFDLHVHTPASEDFTDNKGATTPKMLVDAALGKGLAAIAVTDHQTAEWVDRMKEAARGTELVVFPGVELCATGGEGGVHLILLFDVDKDTNHINQFLNTIKLYQKDGKVQPAVECTVGQIVDALEGYDPTAIVTMAHCHSSKGVLGSIHGETRSLIFKAPRKCLLGAEANESNFLDEEKKKQHKRVIDLLDGTDPNFSHRKLGVYQSSDSHSVATIGDSYTHFKADTPITIEDLRQALIDRDTRIRQSFEYKEQLYPRIERLKVTGGFLDGQEFFFHEGLNNILGPKGSGKSLTIEFLRFALNQEPSQQDLAADHRSKLEKCLKVYGYVEVDVVDESGKRYTIKRTWNPSESHPIEIVDASDGSKKEFPIEELFAVLFLSQNEVVKIAEDRSGGNQREFIDKFFDFRHHQREIERLTGDLTETDTVFADALRSHLSATKIKKQIAAHKEEIEKLGRQITNSVFASYSKKEKVGLAISGQIVFLGELEKSTQQALSRLEGIAAPTPSDADTENDPAFKRSQDITTDAIKSLKDKYQEAQTMLGTRRTALKKEYDDWHALFVPVKAEYDKTVKESGGDQIALDQKRNKLNIALSLLEKELAKFETRAQQMKTTAARRADLISLIEAARLSYFEDRQGRCDFFSGNSADALRVSMKAREDKSDFKNNLLKLKKGSWLKDEDIEKMTGTADPKDFVDALLRYEWSGRSQKETLSDLATKTGLTIENLEKLAEHLLEEHTYETLLSLLYTSAPKDVPVINYRVGAEYKPLEELSVGQKATALLIIALSDGRFPIIIDQPEDSLDLKSIWEDMCKKLRDTKERRQFIFTTHNSSVAVASDSDQFTIMEATAKAGRVVVTGSINLSDVRDEVITYLEGGNDTYDQKRQKYNR